ncbi:hypothetical protein [Nocardia cyriacigeorgica]|nr:hypothetical protein [Nocardia cyriacigeorgica]
MGRFRNEMSAAFGHHLGLLDTTPIEDLDRRTAAMNARSSTVR